MYIPLGFLKLFSLSLLDHEQESWARAPADPGGYRPLVHHTAKEAFEEESGFAIYT